jgi:hypothetical protein
MGTQRTPISDRDLWRSLATGPAVGGVASAPVSDLDFAAWLEGRLDEAEAARIEAAVAHDPDLRRAALELADILGQDLPAAPPRLEIRARALVGFQVERRPSRQGFFDWLFAWDRRQAVPRAIALTAAVIVSVSGFLLGGGLGEQMAGERYAASAPQTARTVGTASGASELTDFLASDGL